MTSTTAFCAATSSWMSRLFISAMRTMTFSAVVLLNPFFFASTRWIPGGIIEKAKCPVTSLATSRCTPAALVRVIRASLITAPLGSFTIPVICPVGGGCASALPTAQKKVLEQLHSSAQRYPPYIEGGVDRDRLFITQAQVSLGAKKFLG